MAFRRAREFVNESDDITRVIAGVALLLLLVIALPVLAPSIPGIANGATCSALFSPPGNGSNQSIMAEGVDATALHLDLSIPTNPVAIGQPLALNVRFINESTAPIILAFVPDEAVFRYTGNENGLMFFIQAASGQVLGEPANVKPPAPIRQQFSSNVLHWLSPRQHCTETITIAPNRVAAAGMGQGQYQIIAVYRNLYRGTLPAIAALTPTAVFRDQGVWTTPADGVRSNAAILTIGAAR